jgi:signal transduction histidine kinase
MSDGPDPEWLVVLRADGVVDSVEGGAPVTWLGHALVDMPGTPAVLRNAAADLVDAPPTSNVRRRKVRWMDGDKELNVEVLLVEALPLRRAHTRIHELVMRTLDVFASQAKSNKIDLTIDQAADVPTTVVLDGEKIAWALSTLVGNALRYARSHVGVHVRWDEATSELVVDVTDDGPGMPEHQTRWLFERNPASGKSAGLALLMVRDVLAAHRGSVSVRSHIGDGTTFTMRIPRVRPA